MEVYDFQKEIIDNPSSRNLKLVKQFLNKQNLELDDVIDYTVALENDGQVIATGSLGGHILKCIAIDREFRGYGLSNIIVSELLNEEYRRNNDRLFVYTKLDNEILFKEFGFYTLEKAEKVVVLENKKDGIELYCKDLLLESLKLDKDLKKYKSVSSIVMNCNPFTTGHRYLIEKASKESDLVHLFILSEDKSVFPSNIRYALVKDGIKDLDNVIIHKATDYIISSSTFPSYFLKKKTDVAKSQAMIDAKIFSKHIASTLNIKRRYIGTEPNCEVTALYNDVLKNVLFKDNIDVLEVERTSSNGEVVSASKVRSYLKYGDFEKVKNMVTENTYEFLLSEEGKKIINKI